MPKNIFINEEKIEEITVNKYIVEKSEIGVYTISIKAVSSNNNYSISDSSNEVEFIVLGGALETPILMLEGDIITWNAVPNAENYMVYINSELKSTISTNVYKIVETIVGDYTITIKAVTSVNLFTESMISNSVTYKVMPFELGEVETKNVSGSINLSESIENADVLYWEDYGLSNLEMKYNAEDLIISNSIENADWYFYDYQANLNWINGTVNRSYMNNTAGRCSAENISIKVKINENVKKIIIFTGAWRAQNTIALSLDGVDYATSEIFSAEDSSINKCVIFNINSDKECIVDITVKCVVTGDNGNTSLTAIAIAGTNCEASTSVDIGSKNEMTSCQDNYINLTEKGTNDWYYFNYENNPDKKNGGTGAIDGELVIVENNGKYWDYKAAFGWTDGSVNATSPIDNDNSGTGTNNGVCGAFISLNIDVTSETQNVYLYVSGYSSIYYLAILNSNGNIISNTLISETGNNNSKAYEVKADINATKNETLTFVLYRLNEGNCGIAAVAVN
jgi:hypothetical protein